MIVATMGTVISFLLVGVISLAGKRGSAPTLTLSSATFGIVGNIVPVIISYLLTVGSTSLMCSALIRMSGAAPISGYLSPWWAA